MGKPLQTEYPPSMYHQQKLPQNEADTISGRRRFAALHLVSMSCRSGYSIRSADPFRCCRQQTPLGKLLVGRRTALRNRRHGARRTYRRWTCVLERRTGSARRPRLRATAGNDRDIRRELHERYSDPVTQLANIEPITRRAGAHAIASLAHWSSNGNQQQQLCSDLFMSYLQKRILVLGRSLLIELSAKPPSSLSLRNILQEIAQHFGDF
jgi:hypothetical protein